MKITIMHLYYDLLNLYGENGNIKALKNTLEHLGIDVYIKFVTLGEVIDLKNVDLLYIGMGTISNQKLALEHICKYKKEIEEYINNNGFVLATGNAMELFGKKINYLDKPKKALEIFDFEASEINFKIADEVLCKTEFIKNYIIGFTNRNSVIKEDIKNPLFEVVKGTGNNLYNNKEGFQFKNFYGTYLIGPILIRNPEFLKYLIKKLVNSKNKNFKLKKFDLTLENKAYHEFMNNYYKEYIK